MDAKLILTAIIAVAGVVGTVLSWRYNPKRIAQQEFDSILIQLVVLERKRDEAIFHKDADSLTRITATIVQLHERQKLLFQRLG